jgi:hypothetical protein
MLSFLPGKLPGDPGEYRRRPVIKPFPDVCLYSISIILPEFAGGIAEALLLHN